MYLCLLGLGLLFLCIEFESPIKYSYYLSAKAQTQAASFTILLPFSLFGGTLDP